MNKNNGSANLVTFIKNLQKNNISASQINKDVRRYIEHKSRELRIPLIGTFELTPLCNLDCKMCYVHLTHEQTINKKILTVEEWKYIFTQAIQVGMRQAKLTGGECLIYPGFKDLYLFLEAKKIRINIATNGILLNENQINFFIKHPPASIQVSLYGSSNDIYQKVTGHRCFKKVYSNLINIRDAGLPVTIAITPNQYMLSDLNNLLKITESLAIPYRINSFLMQPREDTGRKIKDLSNRDYIEIFRKWNEIKHNHLSEVDPEELPSENHNGKSRYGIQCGAGRSLFAILYDGTMCPCLSLTDLSVDVLKLGFEEAWKEVTLLADKYPIPQECGDCIYRSRCLICPAAHKNAPRFGHCDPRVCEQTKGYISAGIVPFPVNEEKK